MLIYFIALSNVLIVIVLRYCQLAQTDDQIVEESELIVDFFLGIFGGADDDTLLALVIPFLGELDGAVVVDTCWVLVGGSLISSSTFSLPIAC